MRALLALALLSALSCVAYNDDCQPLVPNPEQIDGYLAAPVFIDKPNVRHANNGLGQLAAEAYRLQSFPEGSTSDPNAHADVAVINAGGIRAEGTCVTRNILPKGPLRSGVLHDAMPFDNQVLALTVRADELVTLFEYGADGLSAAGSEITNPPSQLLHPSGAVVEIDCTRPIGSRVVGLQVKGVDVKRADAGSGLLVAADAGFRLALTDFLLLHGQGTADVLRAASQDATRNAVYATDKGGVDSYIVEDYLARFTADQPFVPDGGLIFDSCAVPPPPAQ